MFLKVEQQVENIFVLLESSWFGGIYIVYLNK